MTNIVIETLETPLGPFSIYTQDTKVIAAHLAAYAERSQKYISRYYPGNTVVEAKIPADISRSIHAYFEGNMSALDQIPVHLEGTEFQNTAWNTLRTIKPGQILSYAAMAKKISKPKAVRAVGNANGQNPIGIIVPCHRVIGKDGQLRGYGGPAPSGLRLKAWLLDHERQYIKEIRPAA